MTQAPTPGPLSASDVKLLVKGDLLRGIWDGSLWAFARLSISGLLCVNGPLPQSVLNARDEIDSFSFIGRPDAEGWIKAPEGGWKENPVPGRNVEVLASNGVIWDVGIKNDWRDPHPFRLAPTAPVEASGAELLPCPFCGGEAEIVHLDDGDNVGGSCVCCTKCQASGNVEFGRKENFVENWNRRAALRPQPSGETRADALRAAGWSVAVHNDYRLNGEAHTFWLWTHPDGRWVKGEGRNDEEALAECASLIRPAPVASGGRHSSGEDAAWTWLNGHVECDPADRDYSADEMVDAFMAGAGRYDRWSKALERIAGEHQHRSGYCQTDITVEPALTAEEAQTVARDALSGTPVQSTAPVAETAGEAVACWIDGAPSGFRAQEWFIAKTTYGDRVVLRALPDEYAYDFKTADETYIRRDKVAAWMPFPDSEFTPPVPAQDNDKLREPNLFWSAEGWEYTYSDLTEAYKEATGGTNNGVVKIGNARELAPIWAVQIDIDTTGDGEADDYEIKTFATKEEADAYLADALKSTAAKEGEKS
jgi:Lar family restriction alleviation protein